MIRDRNSLYRLLDDGNVENVYTVRILNKDTGAHTLRLSISGLQDATHRLRAKRVSSWRRRNPRVRVRARGHAVAGSVEVKILARSENDDEPHSSAVAALRRAAEIGPGMSALAAERCFHCGEALAGSTFTARISGHDEPVCCAGCLAVAELIAGAGLSDYYRLRENPGVRPERSTSADDRWAALNLPEVAAQFVRTAGDADAVTLAVDGLRCTACGWLVDHMLQALPGVMDASTNAATGRTHVRWERSQLGLGDVARCIADLGYRPIPLGDGSTEEAQQHERRDALKRLAVAGFGMMQVMMFAVAVYSADLAHEIMDPTLLKFFRTVSLLVTTPVVFYAGAPIFAAAWRNVQTRSLGMDVPVALALALAYGASLYNALWAGAGEVYFDSVTMFIFFLTLARYVQMLVRHRTIALSDALLEAVPDHAHR